MIRNKIAKDMKYIFLGNKFNHMHPLFFIFYYTSILSINEYENLTTRQKRDNLINTDHVSSHPNDNDLQNFADLYVHRSIQPKNKTAKCSATVVNGIETKQCSSFTNSGDINTNFVMNTADQVQNIDLHTKYCGNGRKNVIFYTPSPLNDEYAYQATINPPLNHNKRTGVGKQNNDRNMQVSKTKNKSSGSFRCRLIIILGVFAICIIVFIIYNHVTRPEGEKVDWDN